MDSYSCIFWIMSMNSFPLWLSSKNHVSSKQYYEGIRAAWLARKSGQSHQHPFDISAYKNMTLVGGFFLPFLSSICVCLQSHVPMCSTFWMLGYLKVSVSILYKRGNLVNSTFKFFCDILSYIIECMICPYGTHLSSE